MEFIGFGIAGVLVALASIAGYIEIRRVGRTAQLVSNLKQYEPLFLSDRWTRVQYRVDKAGEMTSKWQRGILLVTHKRLAIYPYVPPDPNKTKALFTVQPGELRGFWRPVKYSSGENELWIHAEIASQWHVIKLKLYYYDMQALIRAMKAISTPEQTKAYRRRRPYIHRGLTTAFPAQQSLTGEWELGTAIQLYLMPLYLVILVDNRVVQRYDLAKIQDIAALKRMEGGKPEGLIRFFIANELRAFALDDYEAWAESLAEAAKRTLEEPVVRKRKSKEDDEDDWDEDSL